MPPVILKEANVVRAPTEPFKVTTPADPPFNVNPCTPDPAALIAPPKLIIPLLALVFIIEVPDKTTGTALVIVKELEVIFDPILTLLVPAVDEIKTAPSRVVPPRAPENVIIPVLPAFNVKS